MRSIWFRPTETIAYIAHENPGYRLFVLPVAAGFLTLPTVALFSPEDSDLRIGLVYASLLAFGPVAEIMQVFIGAYLIRLTGAWLGGNAESSSIQTAIVWGNAPIAAMTFLSIVALVCSISYAAVFGENLTWGQSSAITALGWGLTVLQATFIVWSFTIFLKGVAVVQGFSVRRAAVNAILAWSIPAAVVVTVMLGFGFADRLTWLFFAGLEDLVIVHGTE